MAIRIFRFFLIHFASYKSIDLASNSQKITVFFSVISKHRHSTFMMICFCTFSIRMFCRKQIQMGKNMHHIHTTHRSNKFFVCRMMILWKKLMMFVSILPITTLIIFETKNKCFRFDVILFLTHHHQQQCFKMEWNESNKL